MHGKVHLKELVLTVILPVAGAAVAEGSAETATIDVLPSAGRVWSVIREPGVPFRFRWPSDAETAVITFVRAAAKDSVVTGPIVRGGENEIPAADGACAWPIPDLAAEEHFTVTAAYFAGDVKIGEESCEAAYLPAIGTDGGAGFDLTFPDDAKWRRVRTDGGARLVGWDRAWTGAGADSVAALVASDGERSSTVELTGNGGYYPFVAKRMLSKSGPFTLTLGYDGVPALASDLSLVGGLLLLIR